MSIYYNGASNNDIIRCPECGNTRYSIINLIRDTKCREFRLSEGIRGTVWRREPYMIEIQTCKCTKCGHEWEVETELNPEKSARRFTKNGGIIHTS